MIDVAALTHPSGPRPATLLNRLTFPDRQAPKRNPPVIVWLPAQFNIASMIGLVWRCLPASSFPGIPEHLACFFAATATASERIAQGKPESLPRDPRPCYGEIERQRVTASVPPDHPARATPGMDGAEVGIAPSRSSVTRSPSTAAPLLSPSMQDLSGLRPERSSSSPETSCGCFRSQCARRRGQPRQTARTGRSSVRPARAGRCRRPACRRTMTDQQRRIASSPTTGSWRGL